MKEAFEKILEFIDEQIKIEESIAKSENEGHPITHQYGANCMNVIKKIVQEVAEEYNNGWIACSDRLPVAKEKRFGNKQKRTDVLVTLRNGVVKEMTYEFATKKFWEAGDENPIEHWKEDYNGNDIEVIAWQSLPEPYELT